MQTLNQLLKDHTVASGSTTADRLKNKKTPKLNKKAYLT